MSTRDARVAVERAVSRFDLSRTLTKKIAAAVLDEFVVVEGRVGDTGQPTTMLMLMESPIAESVEFLYGDVPDGG